MSCFLFQGSLCQSQPTQILLQPPWVSPRWRPVQAWQRWACEWSISREEVSVHIKSDQ
jgi:hypothetical protein